MILSSLADIKLTKDCLPPLPPGSSLLTQNKKLKSDLFTKKKFTFFIQCHSLFCILQSFIVRLVSLVSLRETVRGQGGAHHGRE